MKRTAILATIPLTLFLVSCSGSGSQDSLQSTPPPSPYSNEEITEAVSIPPTFSSTAEVENGDQIANADVLQVQAVRKDDGTWTFDVTVSHPDASWEDYADGWDVVTEEGIVLKANSDDPFTRLLLHPHIEEQPFTRSQSGIIVPPGTVRLTVRAHDIVAGFGGDEVVVDLSADYGPNFTVEKR
ncbi:MAG: hypothetical protein ACK2T3_07210 [Candidatus Promineifilaceae bacterium]